MNINSIIEILVDPITLLLFNDPVITEDMIIYEREIIDNLYESSHSEKITSPITQTVISSKVVSVIPIKELINVILELYPEYNDEQYIYMSPPYDFNKNFKKIKKQIENNEYSKLYLYNNYDYTRMYDDSNMNYFLRNNTDNVLLEHIYNNLANIDTSKTKLHYKTFQCIFYQASYEMIQYFIKKYPDLDYNYYADNRFDYKAFLTSNHRLSSEQKSEIQKIIESIIKIDL